MKVEEIKIILTNSTDEIHLFSNLSSAIWPFTTKQVFKTEVTHDAAISYVKKYFPNIKCEVIDIRFMQKEVI